MLITVITVRIQHKAKPTWLLTAAAQVVLIRRQMPLDADDGWPTRSGEVELTIPQYLPSAVQQRKFPLAHDL